MVVEFDDWVMMKLIVAARPPLAVEREVAAADFETVGIARH